MKLEPCITALGDQVYLQEPLVLYLHHCIFGFVLTAILRCICPPQGHLLSCTLHCLLWLQKTGQSNCNADDSDEEGEEAGYQSELHTIFDSMSRRMIKSEPEDFELVNLQERHMNSNPITVYSTGLLLLMRIINI